MMITQGDEEERKKWGSLTTELCQKVGQEKEGNLQPSASTNDIKCKQKYYVTEFIENDAWRI